MDMIHIVGYTMIHSRLLKHGGPLGIPDLAMGISMDTVFDLFPWDFSASHV
jgi:hypothetical protein